MKTKYLAVFLFIAFALAQAQSSLVYGNAFQGSGGLANLEIGKFAGRKLDIRFLAEHSAVLTGATLYMKTGVGYSLGTGGTVKMALQADDGTSNHFPSGSDLDSVSAAPGNPASPTFRTFVLSGGVSASTGSLYHLVLTNTDADPVNNYVSLDSMGSDTNTAAPYFSGNPIQLNCPNIACYQNFAVLWQNTSAPWAIKTDETPIASINYASTTSQGNGYVDELVSSGLFTVQGANQAGEIFTPTSNTYVKAINAWVKKTGSPSGPLTIALATTAGTAIDAITIPASSVGTSYLWVSSALSQTKLLASGTSYRASMSAPSDVSNNYQVFPMERGGPCCGFNVTSLPTGTNYQTNTGSGWTDYLASTAYDLPLFFTPAPPPPPPPSSGILNSSRVIDWTQTPTTIPVRTTICSSIAAGSSAATINSAIAACPANGVVLLAAGSYSLTTGLIFNGKPNVTLRGAGANSTFLTFSAGNSCSGQTGNICMISNPILYSGSAAVQPGGTQACSWTAGYSQGSTTLTMASCGSSPPLNQFIILDQANDTTDTGGVFICDVVTTCRGNSGSNQDGRIIGGVTYSYQQLVKVTGVTSLGGGGYTVTISPGIYATNIRSGQTPGAWWPGYTEGDGIEDLSMDFSGNTSSKGGVSIDGCYGCYIQRVRSIKGNRNHVWLNQTAKVVVRDSYFFGTQNGASQSYGVEPEESSDFLVENNIFQQVTSPVLFGQGTGAVIGYNFTVGNFWASPTTFMQASYTSHNAGSMMNLWEGNSMNGIYCDQEWGSSDFFTLFRNQVIGWQSGKNNQTNAIIDMKGCRGNNDVGNVVGQAAYHTQYQLSSSAGSTGACNQSEWVLGLNSQCSTSGASSLTQSTMMRWGNYDVVNAAVRWDATESAPAAAGAGATVLAGNTMPATHTLPSSFYLNSKPSWFGTAPYPLIGPDITGGNVSGVGGFANQPPAQVCYVNNMSGPADGLGSVLAFNPSACYVSSVTPRTGGVVMKGVLIK